MGILSAESKKITINQLLQKQKIAYITEKAKTNKQKLKKNYKPGTKLKGEY